METATLKRVTKADIRRFFAANIGREIEAEWPTLKIVGNLGTVVEKFPRTKRTVLTAKKTELSFQTPKGISYMKLDKRIVFYMDDDTIEAREAETDTLVVRYIL